MVIILPVVASISTWSFTQQYNNMIKMLSWISRVVSNCCYRINRAQTLKCALISRATAGMDRHAQKHLWRKYCCNRQTVLRFVFFWWLQSARCVVLSKLPPNHCRFGQFQDCIFLADLPQKLGGLWLGCCQRTTARKTPAISHGWGVGAEIDQELTNFWVTLCAKSCLGGLALFFSDQERLQNPAG